MKRERLLRAIARLKLRNQDWQKMRPKTTTNAAKTSPTIPVKTAEESRQLFRKAAKRLRDRTLRDFLANELPRFQRLNETLEKKWGLPVPTLSVCGSGTEEIRFTKLLGWHLDCRNPHGLQGLLGRALGETVLGEDRIGLAGEVTIGIKQQLDALAQFLLAEKQRADAGFEVSHADHRRLRTFKSVMLTYMAETGRSSKNILCATHFGKENVVTKNCSFLKMIVFILKMPC